MRHDVIVVGAGLFGRIIGTALAGRGRDVLLLDDERPSSGSVASGNLMKPSWFAGLGKDVHAPALRLLSDHFDVRPLRFKTGLGRLRKEVTVLYLPHDSGSQLPRRPETVTSVAPGRVTTSSGGVLSCELLVVAAGVWCDELLGRYPDLRAKQGISFHWATPTGFENTIRPWAPYKQVVAFEVPGTRRVWAGDGTAIFRENWTEDREAQCRDRVRKFGGLRGKPIKELVGLRPYVRGAKPCLLEWVNEDLVVVTGGAKNGVVAAGWAASEIVRITT